METIRKVLRYIKKYRFQFVISILLAAVSAVLTLYVPILVGNAIDNIIGPDNVDLAAVAKILLRIGFVVVITAVFQWLMNIINNNITYQVVRDIRKKAFRKIEILPLSYIDTHPHGEIVSRVITDVDQFADGLLMGFSQLFTGIVTIIGTLIFMLTINVKITAVVVILTPLSLFAANFIARRTYSMFRLQSEIRGEQTSFINEMIGGAKTVQAFNYHEEAQKKFDEINNRLEKASLRAVFYSSLTNPCTRFINSLVYAAVALAGALMVIGTIPVNSPLSGGTAAGGTVTSGGIFAAGSALTVGGLASLLSYASQYAKPFNEISGVITELQNAIACAGRVFELIEEKPQIPDKKDAVKLENASGNVTAEKVSFSYVPGRPLIRSLNLTVKPGQRVAIVGPTGSGKTTVINLLMRFYDVDSGSIKVEGTDIRNITRKSLRENYGMVLQDTWLKSATIRENIAMGRPDASDEEIIAAAKAAHAHSFIKRLPKGYDTVIGEDGGSLSQGQMQLLSISRVMLSLPPMLILDEATSSIDTRTEVKIQDAFARLMHGRTSFIVAHRLSTIREADIILVMKDGDIIEQGTHDELLARKGFYAKLYNSQFDQ